ncbi:MAG: glycosyltransferase [Flavobacteriales bacterium]|nr:glycosyltransferase [Flavobacteriales bacterium]
MTETAINSPKKQDTKTEVLIIGPAWPLRGGLSTYDHILANSFLEEGYKVKVLTFKLQYPSFLFPGKTQYSTDPTPNLDIRVEINSINPFNWLLTGIKYRKIKPDLVVVRYWLPFMGPCLGTITRIIRGNKISRIVAITDNIIPHEKRPGDRWFTKYFIGACHGFVAMSMSVIQDLKKIESLKPALYNPHPIYNSFKKSIPKAEACSALKLDPSFKYLLFFGFVRSYKGLDLLIEAFSKTDYRKYKLKLIVAGEFYEDEKPYQQMVEKLGLQENIVFFSDFIPDTEVHLFFSASDLLVQPYKNATQSGVTQIGYFYDKPMIVTNTGGLSELVADGKAGFVVPVDIRAIKDAIERFFSEDLSESMSDFVRKEKEKYSWNKMIGSLLKAAKINLEK